MHLLGLTSGYIDRDRDASGVWWVGIRCPKCRKLMHRCKSNFQQK